MTTAYPGAVDVYTAKIDGTTVEAAKDINDLQDAVVAIENNAGRGTLGYAAVAVDQGSITTVVDLANLSVTVTVAAGRRLKITAEILVQSTVAGDSALLGIQEGATVFQFSATALPALTSYTIVAVAVLTPTAGAHTYKLTLQRQTGTGAITMHATANANAFILVEDIGQ